MRKIIPILFIGALSMFFAEVLSGASQAWFLDFWGVFVTYPLYLAHVLFFLWLALRWRKVSLWHLYFFGVLFGLYESWITKVLWAGYMDAAGPGFGTLLGVAMPEFPILVFFWHPLMSFIMPILAFEILTGKVLIEHEPILRKTKWKNIFVLLCIVLFSSFIANGNQYNVLSANLAVIGTLIVIAVLYLFARKYDLRVFELGKLGGILVGLYLILLYTAAFFLMLPERLPQTLMPYVSILGFYGLIIVLILKSPKGVVELVPAEADLFSKRSLLLFAVLLVIAVNIECLVPEISALLLAGTYFSTMMIGFVLFVTGGVRMIKQVNHRKKHGGQHNLSEV